MNFIKFEESMRQTNYFTQYQTFLKQTFVVVGLCCASVSAFALQSDRNHSISLLADRETFNDKTKGIPTAVEGQVLQNFLDENGRLPKWNVAF